MLGVDLVLPDFTWLREQRRPGRSAASPPTATRTTSAGCRSCCASCRSRSTGRRSPSAWPGTASRRPGLLGSTELIPVGDGERRQIGPFDVEFIPVTHSVPHGFATAFHTPQGVILHTGDWKLDLTPVDGRLTDLARIGRHRRTSRASGCCMGDSTNADSHGHSPQREERRRGALRPVPRARGPADRHRLLRQPHPPRPADRRRRHRLRPQGRHPRAVDEEEHAAGPGDGAAAHPRVVASSTSRTSATWPTARSA